MIKYHHITYENDVSSNFYAHKMFMGAQGLGPMGLMEKDPLIIQAEMQLMKQQMS